MVGVLRNCTFFLVTGVLLSPALPPQSKSRKPKPEAVLRKTLTELVNLSRKAKAAKAVNFGKSILQRVIDDFDRDHKTARRLLGYKRLRKAWVIDARARPWRKGIVSPPRLLRYQAQAKTLFTKATHALRDAGLADLAAGRRKKGTNRLHRVLRLLPGDLAAANGLGLEVVNKFALPPTEAVFARKGLHLQRLADQLRYKRYNVNHSPGQPIFISGAAKRFKGAQSARFLVFTVGSAELAGAACEWGERTLDFLAAIFPTAKDQFTKAPCSLYLHFWNRESRRIALAPFMHLAVSSTIESRRPDLLGFSALRGVDGPAEFCAIPTANRLCQAITLDTVEKCWRPNHSAGVDEGLALAITGLLHGQIDVGFSQGSFYLDNRRQDWPTGLTAWVQASATLADNKKDRPFGKIAGAFFTELDRSGQLKLWSFMSYLLRLDPRATYDAFNRPSMELMGTKQVDSILQTYFKQDLPTLEGEWRKWITGQSLAAAAEGLRPKLSSDPPAKVITALQHLNTIRDHLDLSPVKADGGLCAACIRHAEYLADLPKTTAGRELHLENPNNPGYSPEGARVAINSFILTENTMPTDFVDQGLASFYHRVALLAPDLEGVGIAFCRHISLLDCSSLHRVNLEKGIKTLWYPPDGAAKVPCRYSSSGDRPNPLLHLNKKCADAGYPITFILPCRLRHSLQEATITLTRNSQKVEGFTHNFKNPLRRDIPLPQVVGFIPAAPLAPGEIYRARVQVKYRISADRSAEINSGIIFVTAR